MKILYLTDQTYLHGGVERVLSQKANYFADISGDEVTIITYNQNNNKPCYSFSNKIKFVDLQVDYQIEKSYFHPYNLKKIPHHFSSLKKVLKKMQPDIVISSSFGPDFYFIPYLEKHIPKIKEFHSSRFFYKKSANNSKKKLLHGLNNITENQYHQLVVLNNSETQFYNSPHISVIPNPAEISNYRTNFTSKKIVAAGRISPVKNFGDLVEVFSLVSKDFPDWELHFFGEDYVDTQTKITQKIDAYGLQGQVQFKGITSDLKKEMQNYSIFAMTSETECFPMVLLEALSVGLPVISYDSPTGPRHILKDEEDSLLVPYKNLDIFTIKLKDLMQNENLRQEMGKKGILNVQRFSIDKVMQQWQNLFNDLRSHPHPHPHPHP